MQAVTILPFFHNFFCPHSDNNSLFRGVDVAVMGSGSKSRIQVTFSQVRTKFGFLSVFFGFLGSGSKS